MKLFFSIALFAAALLITASCSRAPAKSAKLTFAQPVNRTSSVKPDCYVVLANVGAQLQPSVKGKLKSKNSDWVVIETAKEDVWIPQGNVVMLVVSKESETQPQKATSGITQPEYPPTISYPSRR